MAISTTSATLSPESDGFLTVATTRPETMLGDTAVAVNPEDDRYHRFIGKEVILPIAQKENPGDRRYVRRHRRLEPVHSR